MAGYLFTLDNLDALKSCVEQGHYSTRIRAPKGHWSIPAEGTLADFVTMTPGDNVYFFIKRRIYGVGELVDIAGSCRHLNYPQALSPTVPEYAHVRDQLVFDEGVDSLAQRWICFFKPSPSFFTDGVDMDDVLSSNPSVFRMLRAMWKLSFIKFDDEENRAFRDAVLKANQDLLARPTGLDGIWHDEHTQVHEALLPKLSSGEYDLSAAPIAELCADGTQLRHEMAIEAAALDQIQHGEESAIATFGRWDYLSHQVVASPFKPIDYMDKMDLFGYRFIPNFRPTISKFLVGEIKAGAAHVEDVDQLLKYVDWVKDEYAHGDYSMIIAFLVAHEFDDACLAHITEQGQRMYTYQRRPARTVTWQDLRPVRYSHVGAGRLRFDVAAVPSSAVVPL
jgi:hypothetical protein